MGKSKGGRGGGGDRNDNRTNGKAPKKYPKIFDKQKRRLVTDK